MAVGAYHPQGSRELLPSSTGCWPATFLPAATATSRPSLSRPCLTGQRSTESAPTPTCERSSRPGSRPASRPATSRPPRSTDRPPQGREHCPQAAAGRPRRHDHHPERLQGAGARPPRRTARRDHPPPHPEQARRHRPSPASRSNRGRDTPLTAGGHGRSSGKLVVLTAGSAARIRRVLADHRDPRSHQAGRRPSPEGPRASGHGRPRSRAAPWPRSTATPASRPTTSTSRCPSNPRGPPSDRHDPSPSMTGGVGTGR